MSTNDGGPAFPLQWLDFLPTTGEQVVREQFPGMSLRDWFAGQALNGLLSDASTFGDPESFADSAYKYADAMLKARAK